MSAPWWGRETRRRARTDAGRPPIPPELSPAAVEAIAEELRGRRRNYTSTWTQNRGTDAGQALVTLVSQQMQPVLSRLNRLPDKAFIEYLRIAGVQLLPATPAEAMLAIKVSPAAEGPVLVPQGFQVSAPPATGDGDPVIFETDRDITAVPAEITEVHVQEGRLFHDVTADATSADGTFLPFGRDAERGKALWIGLAGEVAPGSELSFGFKLEPPSGEPPPVGAGGLTPLPVTPAPLQQWDVLDSTTLRPAERSRDETEGLTGSGVIALRTPRSWRAGQPDGLDGGGTLRWLRLRIVHGSYEEAPQLSFVALNMVRASAARTIRNESIEAVPGSDRRRFRLSETPVVPNSLVVEVDEAGIEAASVRWEKVDDLAANGPEDRVFAFDPASGELTFGDDRHGRRVPDGFRNLRAVRYRVGGGKAGAVEAETITTLLSSAPFVTEASNPFPAVGGTDQEPMDDALERGPEEIRARGRAVTLADYELMAPRAPGAQVERAHAVSGLHPRFPGRPIPGVVGVFVVPPGSGEGPPIPDEAALGAVARFLSDEVAPVGVEVVAAATRFHRVRAEVGIVVDPAADVGGTVKEVVDKIDGYLSPFTGGDDGQGWPFGGMLRYTPLLLLITNVAGVTAVPRLNVLVDGVRVPRCTDYAISPHALLWPEGHTVLPREPDEAPR